MKIKIRKEVKKKKKKYLQRKRRGGRRRQQEKKIDLSKIQMQIYRSNDVIDNIIYIRIK